MEGSIPTIQSLNLPEAFNKMTGEINGFILVSGATGSGKSAGRSITDNAGVFSG